MERNEKGQKLRRVRDYSRGSILQAIRRVQAAEDLEVLRQIVVALAAQGLVSTGTLRKLDEAGAAKARELSERVIVVPGGGPRSPGGIILP